MKSALKIAMIAIGLTLIVTAVCVLLLGPHLERLTARTLEGVLSEVFGSSVSIGGVAVSPSTRTLDLHDVSLANPEGFKEGPAIESKRVRLSLQWPSIFSETPVVRSAVLEGADIHYRYQIGKGTNLARLEELAKKNAATRGPSPFSIGEISCEEAKVHLSTNLIPLTSLGVDLVDVSLKEADDKKTFSAGTALANFVGSTANEIASISGLLLPEEEETQP